MENAETIDVVKGIEVVNPADHTGKVAAVAFAGYTFDAVDMVITALALPLIMKEWGLNMMQAGTVVTALLIGACFGGFIFGPIADKFGRKKALMWCIAFFSITTGACGISAESHPIGHPEICRRARTWRGMGTGNNDACGIFSCRKKGKSQCMDDDRLACRLFHCSRLAGRAGAALRMAGSFLCRHNRNTPGRLYLVVYP